nr:phosphoenolpyruvate-protein phosphotransferase [Salmonella sp. NCTC 7297]
MIQSRGPNAWPERFILVADELSATTLAELPQDRLAGVVVRDGAANSHAAIMVRALGIPTVMGADIQPSVLHRRTLVVDGYRGELLVDPEPVLIQEYQRLISEEIELSRLAEDDVNLPAQLKSGERVKVMLNAGLSPEHEEKLGSRIDGIGLYRTEIPFMLQSGFPSEEEQVAQYQGMLQMFNDKPVTLRTLDVGADKQLPYMPISEGEPVFGLARDPHYVGSAGDLFDPGPRDAARQTRRLVISAFCCRWSPVLMKSMKRDA